MDSVELLEAMIALADDVGLPVRVAKHAFDGDVGPPQASALCRVKGEWWVVLADTDPIPEQIGVLAGGLRRAAGAQLEGRYLAPAVRAALEAVSESRDNGG